MPNYSTAKPPDRNQLVREDNVMRRLRELEAETGYPIIQNNGQRVCGPPRQWRKPVPDKGSEIFIGNLPRSIIEDELMNIFSTVGDIYQIRLMIDFSGFNRGFAFITYEDPEKANIAIRRFNNFQIRSNLVIGVYKSVDNRRLFIGGISENKTKEEIQMALECYVEDINHIIMYPPRLPNENGSHNRGYVFAEFNSHRSAALARRLLGSGVQLWEDTASIICVDWADPIPEVDPNIMHKIKRLYIRNIPTELTREQLGLELCEYISSNKILRIHKINDYAFIHFKKKRDAERALSILNGAVIAGNKIEVTWSRPQAYSRKYRMNLPAENLCKSVPPKMRYKVHMALKESQSVPHAVSATNSSSSSSCFDENGINKE